MATYLPPLEDLGIFDSAIFSTDSTYLTIGTARKLFLSYPYAQGTENFTDITVAGTSTVKKIIQNIIGSAGTSVDNNIQFGDATSYTALTNGTNNIAIGYGTLDALTTGIGNIAIGQDAGGKLTTAQKTVVIGRDALTNATTVQGAVCIGYRAGYNASTGTDSIAIGNSAGFTTLSNNVIILNASGATLNSAGTSRFYVRPVRNSTTFGQLLYYDNVTAEAVYSAPILNTGYPMTLALGVTDYSTTLNGNSTYLGSYNIFTGTTTTALVDSTLKSVLNITIPIGVSIITVTEKLTISTASATFTRLRRTLSTDGTLGAPATGTVILDQTDGPTIVNTYQTINTYTVINSTGVAIAGSYVVNFAFSTGTITMQASATTIKIA